MNWRRDSQTVSEGVTSTTRSETKGFVRISTWSKSVQWGDRGDYSCQATNNGVTRTSQTLSLVVQVPVSTVTLINITINNQDINIIEDTNLVLTCQTSPSYPAPTVTWYIKGSLTSSGVVSQTDTQTNGQITTISTIAKTVRRNSDRDTYYCRAGNGNGNKQSLTARINVYYGPDNGQISLTKPSVVAEGILVTLTCRTLTAVNPEVDFTWSYGDNTQITSGLGNKQGSARNMWSQTLTLTPVRTNNRQVVRCRVTNTETSESVQAQDLSLDVNYGPGPGEVQVRKASTAIEHDPVTLYCRTSNNVKPDLSFTWTVDGSEVTTGTGVKEGSSGSTWSQTLTLTPNRTHRSVGCNVSNTAFSRQASGSVDLDVMYPPDISMSPVEGTENTDLTLRCTATGNPSTYQFEDFTQYWGSQLIQRRSGRQSGDRYDLTLSRVTYQDSGLYVCTVGNNVKQPSQKNTSVTVKASPVFSKDSDETVDADLNERVTLTQQVYCSPNCTSYNWTFSSSNKTAASFDLAQSTLSTSRVHLDIYGMEVEEEGYKLSYDILNFQKENVGIYTVTACNSVGCSSSSISLKGAGPPLTPDSFIAVNSTTESVTLSWKSHYAGGPFNQEFHVQYKKQSSTAWMVKIFRDDKQTLSSGVVDGLAPDTVYVFRIKSVSDRKAGNNQSPFSHDITFPTKAPQLAIPSTSSPLGVGAGIGIGAGICAVIAAGTVGALFLVRRRQGSGTGGRKKGRHKTEHRHDGNNPDPSTPQQAEYTHLQHNTGQNTYEMIAHHYENTGFEMSPVYNEASTDAKTSERQDIEEHASLNTLQSKSDYANV